MTQTVQDFSIEHGYATPLAISDAGLEEKYQVCMAEIADLYSKIASWNPQVAAYVLPNAFNRRVFCQVNIRSLFHFIKLRSASNAHFSIRRVAYGMLELLQPHYPLLQKRFWQKAVLTVKKSKRNFSVRLCDLE